MKHLKLAAAVLATICAMSAVAAQRNQTLYIMHDNQDSHLRAGDVLVADGEGKAALYRGNTFVRMVQDTEDLLSSHSSASQPLYLTNAEGAVVRGNLASYEGDVFLSAEAPQHVFYTNEFNDAKAHYSNGGSVAATSSCSVCLNLGTGNILPQVKTYSIFWGTYGTDIQSGIASFFNGFSGSSIAAASKEYYGNDGKSVSGLSTNGYAVVDSSTPPKRALSTSSAVAEACKIAGQNGGVDSNGVYFIFTSTGAGHVNYCAWHSWGTCSTGQNIQVAYMPNISGLAGCDPGAPYPSGESQGLVALANVTSHELSEAITDPRGTGWTDSSGSENGDKCAWAFDPNNNGFISFPNGSVWKLQGEWSNNAYNNNTGFPNRSGQNGCLY